MIVFEYNKIKITPCESQKTVAINFPADGTVFAFFGADLVGEIHCFNCCLVSGVYQWIHVSSTITKRRRNSFGLRLNGVKHCSEMVSRFRLLSGVSKSGTQRADSFLMSKISCRIGPTRSFEMPTVSAISRTFNRRSVNARSWIPVTLSSVVAVFRAPGRGSLKIDVRSR